MEGLTKTQLIEILDRANPGERIIKADLHRAVATAIKANDDKIIRNVQARTRQQIKRQVMRHVQAHGI